MPFPGPRHPRAGVSDRQAGGDVGQDVTEPVQAVTDFLGTQLWLGVRRLAQVARHHPVITQSLPGRRGLGIGQVAQGPVQLGRPHLRRGG